MFFDLPLISADAAPEHASAKSHVQTPRDFCITTGAVSRARIFITCWRVHQIDTIVSCC